MMRPMGPVHSCPSVGKRTDFGAVCFRAPLYEGKPSYFMNTNMISLIICFNFVFADEPVSNESTVSDHQLTSTEWHTLHTQYEEELHHSKKLEIIGWIIGGVGVFAIPNYTLSDLPPDEQFQYLLTCGAMVGIGIPLGVVQHRKRIEITNRISQLNISQPIPDDDDVSLEEVTIPIESNNNCCKHCTTGKPCGDSCISDDKECHVPNGCACY